MLGEDVLVLGGLLLELYELRSLIVRVAAELQRARRRIIRDKVTWLDLCGLLHLTSQCCSTSPLTLWSSTLCLSTLRPLSLFTSSSPTDLLSGLIPVALTLAVNAALSSFGTSSYDRRDEWLGDTLCNPVPSQLALSHLAPKLADRLPQLLQLLHPEPLELLELGIPLR